MTKKRKFCGKIVIFSSLLENANVLMAKKRREN